MMKCIVILLIIISSMVYANSNTEVNELFINAIINGIVIDVQNLINQGADVNMYEHSENNTALMIAVAVHNKEILILLISSGANVNMKNSLGNTALYYASKFGFADIVNILISSGAELNLTNTNGETALNIATKNGNTDIVQLLIKAGAE